MKHECVGRFVFRLVGAAKAEKIRRDDAQTRGDEGGNHLAVEVGPCGLAVQAERNRSGPGSFVEIMHA
jgi:hypothetical protein